MQKLWNWNKFYGGLSDNNSIVSAADATKFGNGTFTID